MAEPFADDPLVRRLESMEVPPAPRDLAGRALATARQPEPRRRRPWSGLALVAAGLVLATSAMAATWPASLHRLADLPGVGALTQRAVTYVGTPAPPADGGSATASGFTMRVTSAYDDGNRVILVLRIDRADGTRGSDKEQLYATAVVPTDRSPIGMGPTVTDARGHALMPTNGFGQGHEAFLVFSRPAGGPGAGSALTLHADRVRRWDIGGTKLDATDGQWTLRFHSAPSKAPRDLPVPQGGGVAGVNVAITAVRASDAYLDVRFDTTGPQADMDSTWAELLAPGGDRAQPIDVGRPPQGKGQPPDRTVRTQHNDYGWQLAQAGTYHLVIHSQGGQRLTRDIVVPHGRAANVPALNQSNNPFCCG
jgi:hypothetical protein